jgi:hypothetical protein
MTVVDVLGTPTLYAGGYFDAAGETSAASIARWNGASWLPLEGSEGAGLSSGGAFTLATYDDGSGVGLYAGGRFTQAGGVPANHIARWDGAAWSPLGTGIKGGSVVALTVFDEGDGPALYAGGYFTTAGGVPANLIAKWDGSTWSPLGSGITGQSSLTRVSALEVFDDGSGPALYAGGFFTTAGGVAVESVASWDGLSWKSVGGGEWGIRFVVDFAVYDDDGGGPALYAAGSLLCSEYSCGKGVLRLENGLWSPVSTGAAFSIDSMAVLDDGSGTALYAAWSHFGVLKWTGGSWSELGMSGTVTALEALDDGRGPALYAGAISGRIAKWDGCSWSTLGAGLNSSPEAFIAFDDGAGPAVYVVGWFTTAEDVPSFRIAKWYHPSPPCPE